MHTLTGVLGVGFHLYKRRRRVAPLTPVYYKEKPTARVIPFDKLRDLALTPTYNKERPLRGQNYVGYATRKTPNYGLRP